MEFLKERIGEILQQIEPLCFPIRQNIEEWKGKSGHFYITDRQENDTKDWKRVDPVVLGEDSCAWFGLETEIIIPEEMEGMPVELKISTGREGEWDATNPQMAAYVNGGLWQGVDVNHRSIYLTEKAKAGERFRVFLSVYTGERGIISSWNSVLQTVDSELKELYYDLMIPWQCLFLLEKESREYEVLVNILNGAVNCLDLRRKNGSKFRESICTAKKYLREEIKKLPESEIIVSCIGHTHIDVAWLWTLAVTREKVARSFSTVLRLMEKYPEYLFMSSQSQLYKYVKQNQPELYEKIRKKVQEGRWEPEGAMFLEADCNLINGESLVRQCLYGKAFFKEEFGVDNRILWLPDVFGYSAAMPQILKKCGIDSFMTTKISWNETNKIPCDTFWWEGIDGTEVLTHFITTRDYVNNGKLVQTGKEFTTEFSTNYNGYINPSQIKGAWQRYQEKGLNNNVLVSFGYGDGGGGPTEEMLETARRLNGKFGCPRVCLEKAGDFFEKLHKCAEERKFPVWSGELYLEYHRGTYTSMADNKKWNRKGEFALENAETWASLAEKTGYTYPKEMLYQAWEILMRNQFHDILPGSAIREVYEDSKEEYRHMFEITGKITEDALGYLEKNLNVRSESILVFNPNGIEVSEVVEVAESCGFADMKSIRCGDEVYPVQRNQHGNWIFRAKNVPVKGIKTFYPSFIEKEKCGYDSDSFFSDDHETVTPYYQLKWNETGQITSFYDKRVNRELLQQGEKANVLMTYEDKPHKYDNWNIFEYYQEKSWPVDELISRKVVEMGSVRMAIEQKWKYLDSEISEVFYFYPDNPRIDIHTHIDWKEEQVLLKALFPLDLNVRDATYEIQYGNVKRSTTANTSWEKAKFEVCFQKWLDLSEAGYGVGFLSDCKYGVSVQKNVVGLTLLKSGCYPNEVADRGVHEFIYSIYPHEGNWQESGIIQEAYGLNNPPAVKIKGTELGNLPEIWGAVKVSQPNVVLEVLKKAEDGNGYILRLYESWNKYTKAYLKFFQSFDKVYLCNMLEEIEKLLKKNNYVCEVEMKPFEIITLRVI